MVDCLLVTHLWLCASLLTDSYMNTVIPTMSLQHFFVITHVAGQFSLSTITVSAENVRGFSTPAARVTWNTTAPPQCVASVRVDFRTSTVGPAVATNTTTNTSQTEVIQNGLRCGADYYISVVVTGEPSDGVQVTLNSRQVRAVVGGKKYNIFACTRFNWYSNLIVTLPLHRHTRPNWCKR